MRQSHHKIIDGLTVEVRGNFEKSLRQFNKKVQNSGKLREIKDREYFEKPSERRKKAKQNSKKRLRKNLEKQSLAPNRFR